jgi:flagellin
MSSLVINTNTSAINAYDNLNATNEQLNNVISELSSGLSIQTAANGPAAYVVGEDLQYESEGYTQAIANAQNGESMVNTGLGALNQITDILQTMDQLATDSANGAANSSAARTANQQEFAQLQNDITQIANTTQFGTKLLFTGNYASGQSLQVGAFDYGSNQVTVTIPDLTSNASVSAALSANISTVTGAESAISAVQGAIQEVSSIESSLGAISNELQAIVANLTVGQQNLAAAHSQLVDTNFAEATTKYTTLDILMQSGVAMLSQSQQLPSMALKLLAGI